MDSSGWSAIVEIVAPRTGQKERDGVGCTHEIESEARMERYMHVENALAGPHGLQNIACAKPYGGILPVRLEAALVTSLHAAPEHPESEASPSPVLRTRLSCVFPPRR